MTRLIRPYDLLLDDATGWRVLETTNTSLADGHIKLRQLEGLRPALTDPNGTFGGHTLPRGVAIWSNEIFVADPLRDRILHWRRCCGPVHELLTIGRQSSGSRQLDHPLGLAISHRDDLVVVDSGNRCLLFFTLPGLALRRILGPFESRAPSAVESAPAPEPADDVDGCELETEPADTPPMWQPVDVAAGPSGTLYVADKDGLVWRFDSQGRPDPRYLCHLPEGCVPRRLQVDSQQRIYLIADQTSEVLILDRYGRPMPSIHQLEPRVREWLRLHVPDLAAEGGRNPTFDEEAQARAALLPSELSQLLDVDLNRFLAEELGRHPEKTKHELWIEQRDAIYDEILPGMYQERLPQFLWHVLPRSRLSLLSQEFGLRMQLWLRQQGLDVGIDNVYQAYAVLLSQDPKGSAMASPTGPTTDRVLLRPGISEPCPRQPQLTDLTVDEAGYLRLDDAPLGPYLLHRPPVASFRPAGLCRFEALDSGRMGNLWHRLSFELSVPERTGVRLFSFTSDVLRPDLEAIDPPNIDLTAEPPLLGPWQAAPDNAGEWLIQSPPGRYLYLALVLKGPGDRTPSIERIYVYAQRQSSLRHLPAAYQADETSRHVLDRLLSLFDVIFGEIESEIEDFALRLDVDGAPAGFLPWLASWFDLTLEQSWSEAQRRAFLIEIVELYRWRGTIRGLRRLLQLHANLQEPMPQIVEHYRGIGGEALDTWLGEAPAGDACHHFSVLLPASAIDTPERRAAVERLLNASKPAHTHYTLRPIYPGLRLGSAMIRGAALGLDSLLGSHTPWRLPDATEQNGILGARTVLPAPPRPRAVAVQLGRTRLGAAQLGSRICPPCEESERSKR
ncbi:MAG: phage tail protein [Anaerolineae bacterium]|jgi:phage tail-like protein